MGKEPHAEIRILGVDWKRVKLTRWFLADRCIFSLISGVILPGETRKFFFLFKSERAGIFSESWEFGTHPLLLGGALLQVTLWGIAVYEDKLADLREKLEVTKHVTE